MSTTRLIVIIAVGVLLAVMLANGLKAAGGGGQPSTLRFDGTFSVPQTQGEVDHVSPDGVCFDIDGNVVAC